MYNSHFLLIYKVTPFHLYVSDIAHAYATLRVAWNGPKGLAIVFLPNYLSEIRQYDM
jgi:hypothetical protein